MPKLGLLQCHVKWLGCERPIAEHNTQYHDSHVEAWLPVPLNPTPFYCHLTSNGWIANGLSAFVYIDGEYMCNRTKPNILPPGPNVNPASSCVDFKLRQKEITMVDGQDWGMPWLFSQVNAAPAGHPIANSVPWGGQYVGTIEVLVLRHAPDATYIPRGLMTSAQRSHLDGQTKASSYAGPPRFGLDGADDSYANEAHPSKRAHVMSMDGDPGTGPGTGPPAPLKEDYEKSVPYDWGDGVEKQDKQPDTAPSSILSAFNKGEGKNSSAPCGDWGGAVGNDSKHKDSNDKPDSPPRWGGGSSKGTTGDIANNKKTVCSGIKGGMKKRGKLHQLPSPDAQCKPPAFNSGKAKTSGKIEKETGASRPPTFGRSPHHGQKNNHSSFDWATNTGKDKETRNSPHPTAFNGSGYDWSNDKKAENNEPGHGDWNFSEPSKRNSRKSVAGISMRGSQAGSHFSSAPIQNITINVGAGGSALIGPPKNASPDRESMMTKGTSLPTSETGWEGRKAGIAESPSDSKRNKMPGSWGDENDENDPASFDTGAMNDNTDNWGNPSDEQKNDDWNSGANADDTEAQNQNDDWGATADNNDQNPATDGFGADPENQSPGNGWGDDNNQTFGNDFGNDENQNSGNDNDNGPGSGKWDSQENQNPNEANNTSDDWANKPDASQGKFDWGGSAGQAWGGSQKDNQPGSNQVNQNTSQAIGSQNGNGASYDLGKTTHQQPAQPVAWGDANHNTGGNPNAQPIYIKVVPQANSIPAMQARPGLFPGRSPQPYWAAYKHAQDHKMEISQPVFEAHAGPQPVYSLPISVIERNNTTHQVQLGAATTISKHKYSPKYLDTLDKPFAVFTFHYRDQATLSAMTGTNVRESRAEEAERLSQLSSDELLHIMYGRLDAAGKYIGPMTAPTPAPAPAPQAAPAPQYTMSGAQPASVPEKSASGFGQAIAGTANGQQLADKLASVAANQKADNVGWGGSTTDENVKPTDIPPGPPGPPGGDASGPGEGAPGATGFNDW